MVLAAVNERDVGSDLLEAGAPPRDLLAGKGFNGRAASTFTSPACAPGPPMPVTATARSSPTPHAANTTSRPFH
jgi:hypothetical protein